MSEEQKNQLDRQHIMCGSTRIVIKPRNETHILIEATTARGYVYAVSSAEEDEPITLKRAREIWMTERKKFRKYDQSTGHFLAD